MRFASVDDYTIFGLIIPSFTILIILVGCVRVAEWSRFIFLSLLILSPKIPMVHPEDRSRLPLHSGGPLAQ